MPGARASGAPATEQLAQAVATAPSPTPVPTGADLRDFTRF